MIARRIKSTLHHFIYEIRGASGNPKFIVLSKGKDCVRNRYRVNEEEDEI